MTLIDRLKNVRRADEAMTLCAEAAAELERLSGGVVRTVQVPGDKPMPKVGDKFTVSAATGTAGGRGTQ